jgi:hypothetical protein
VELLKNFQTFYETRRFITVLTRHSANPVLSQINPEHNHPSYLKDPFEYDPPIYVLIFLVAYFLLAFPQYTILISCLSTKACYGIALLYFY